jgi:hypothetical protein
MSAPALKKKNYIKKKYNNGKLVGHEDECYVFINLYSYIINTKFCGKITVLYYFLLKGHRF